MDRRKGSQDKTVFEQVAKSPLASRAASERGLSVDVLREVPEEELWLGGFDSAATRRAYAADVRHFIRTLHIRSRDELRRVDRGAVIFWKRSMENLEAPPRTVRRRLSALSSLFRHLVDRRLVDANPCREIRRPRVNRRRGETRAFSPKQARALLDAPATTTVEGLRDRAILSVGFQVGARRSEIAGLRVRDLHEDQGFDCLRVTVKGNLPLSVALNPQTAQRIRAYLDAAGHAHDFDGPLFRPVGGPKSVGDGRRALHPDTLYHLLRKYVRRLGIGRGFSPHSMRATFITRALDNGAALEDVQRDVGHADASTTKLYDRRGHNPEKSASFFANY